jgi:hypothetical protein
MVVKATCPRCKRVIYGYQWTKTKTGKNWLSNKEGEWHSCGDKAKTKGIPESQREPAGPRYFSCGKCGGNCKEIGFFDYYCEKCEMYPQVCHRRTDELGNGPTDPNVKASVTSNRNEIIAELRSSGVKMSTSDKVVREGGSRSGQKPLNWMCMNEDGTIMSGWKLTSELTEWFNNGGLELIKEINERTILTEKVKPLE